MQYSQAGFTTCVARKGFTLAEVLITLGIIGVVAALTMPALVANYQKKVTATRLKSTFSMLSQAVNLAIADNGDQNTWARPKSYTSDTAGQKDFFDKYIIKYLKLAQDCGNGTGSTTKGCVVINEGVSTDTSYEALTVKVILLNGVHINMLDKPPYETFFLVDINGAQKPNQPGVDQFTFIASNSRISTYDFAPGVIGDDGERERLWEICKQKPMYCAALIRYDGWEIAPDYPW